MMACGSCMSCEWHQHESWTILPKPDQLKKALALELWHLKGNEGPAEVSKGHHAATMDAVCRFADSFVAGGFVTLCRLAGSRQPEGPTCWMQVLKTSLCSRGGWTT